MKREHQEAGQRRTFGGRARLLPLLCALLCLGDAACTDPWGCEKDPHQSQCAGASGSPPASLMCQGGTTIWLCNIANDAFRTPVDVAILVTTCTVGGACTSCGLGFCAGSEAEAKNQASPLTGVDPATPGLVCLQTPAVTDLTFKALGAAGLLPALPSDCIPVAGAMTCGNPCDDGQGGTLQGPGEYCNTGEGMAPVPGGYQCCAGLTCSSTDTLSGVCQGTFPKCAPQPQPQANWQGLTTTILRQIAAQNNIGVGLTGIQQSQKIGLAFEAWVLTTLGVIPKPPGPGRNNMLLKSMARQMANMNSGGLPASVVPEFVGNQPMFSQSVFLEVKAVTGNLTLGTRQSQILGFLDVAHTVPTVPVGPHPPPAVFFITTSNTTVTTGVVSYGAMFDVAVWQQKVLYDANGGSNPNLTLGPAKCLSPSNLCMASVLTNPHPGPPVGSLTSPTTPSSDLLVQDDPDPPEVD